MLIPNTTIVFFSTFSLKIPKRTIFSSNLRAFIFAGIFLKLTIQNYTNKAFLVPKLKLLVLHDLPFHKFGVADSKYNFLKKDFSLKILRKEHFLCPGLD